MNAKGSDRVPMILVGSDCELSDKRQVTIEEGSEIADKYHIPFIEISPKTFDRMEEMLGMIITEISSLSIDNSNKEGGKRSSVDGDMKKCFIQ